MNSRELAREQQVALWVLGALHTMAGWRLLEGGWIEITCRGLACWDQLDAANFSPEDHEIEATIELFNRGKPNKKLVALVKSFRDDRTEMENWVEEQRCPDPR